MGGERMPGSMLHKQAIYIRIGNWIVPDGDYAYIYSNSYAFDFILLFIFIYFLSFRFVLDSILDGCVSTTLARGLSLHRKNSRITSIRFVSKMPGAKYVFSFSPLPVERLTDWIICLCALLCIYAIRQHVVRWWKREACVIVAAMVVSRV